MTINRFGGDEEILKKSFPYQIEQYLIQLHEDFQKEYVDKNHYIDLNGEIRTLKRDGFGMKAIAPKEEPLENDEDGKNYSSIQYAPIDKYITQWLNDKSKNLLVILGEYGTGKTTLCKHLFHQLAEAKLNDTPNVSVIDNENRLPILFFLRNFEKRIETYIISQLTEKGVNDIDIERFKDKIENGEIVLLLDGFDEMTQKIDSDEKKANFDKINTLIRGMEKSKVIITSRSEYFSSPEEKEKVFNTREGSNHQFIYLLPLNNKQIKQYLETHTDNPDDYWKKIKEIFDLHDLAQRPVLLQLIIDYLPQVIAKKQEDETIDASDLYQSCIEAELERKACELEFSIPGKYRLEILHKLCVDVSE